MRILVIGDSCIDKFVYGRCERLNPEAPTPVFIPEDEVSNPGMAANVLQNFESLGLYHVELITNTVDCYKVRFVEKNSNYILLRVDSGEDKIGHINVSQYDFSEWDVVVISDYNKGFLTESDIEHISNQAKITFMDTKKPLSFWANNITWIKINSKEFSNPQHNPDFIKQNLDKIIVTMGNRGSKLNDKIFPTELVEVRDVVGAGDTFLTALVTKFIQTNSIEESIKIANLCASESVKHKGVVDLSKMKKYFTYEK